MKYPYPKTNSFLEFERCSETTYYVRNLWTSTEYEVREKVKGFLEKLDGNTCPYTIAQDELEKEDVDEILEIYKRYGFLESKSKIEKDGLLSYFITFPFTKLSKNQRILAKLWNKLLMYGCIPILLLGVLIVFQDNYPYVEHGYRAVYGIVLGLVLGKLFNQWSYVAACSSYEYGDVRGMVFGVEFLVPYFRGVVKYQEISNKLAKLQILAAGSEMNIMLTGVFLCLLRLGIFDSELLICAAVGNLLLLMGDIILVDSRTGMDLLEEILGIKKLVEKSKNLLMDNKSKRRLHHKEWINGLAVVVLACMVCLYQMIIPLLVLFCLFSCTYIF